MAQLHIENATSTSEISAVPINTPRKIGFWITTLIDCIAAIPSLGGRRLNADIIATEKTKKVPAIQNPIFLGVFMGSALISLVLVVFSMWSWATSQPYYILAGATLYVIGSFMVTVVFNVPLNNALDAADSTTASGRAIWANYLTTWTFWNHVRTVASILSTAAFGLALFKN